MNQDGAPDVKPVPDSVNAVSERVIGAAVEVHRHLGPGLLESAYEQCLCRELLLRNIGFQRQVAMRVEYKGVVLPAAFRVDLLVEDTVVVELKAAETINPIHQVQLLTCLRLTGFPLGLLINFHSALLWRGVRRVVNRL